MTILPLQLFCPQNAGDPGEGQPPCPLPRAKCRGGRKGAGHRPALWQVPEVCNLLRHLKNINRNLSSEGTASPVTMAMEGRGARGESEKAVGSSREATMTCVAFSGMDGIPPCSWVNRKKLGLGPAETFLFPSEWKGSRDCLL